MSKNKEGPDPYERLPAGLELVRTTAVFDQASVPAGLLKAHRIAAGTWGQLVVHSGTVQFVFEDAPTKLIEATTNNPVVIPPDTPHHIVLSQAATFAVEFYK